MVSRANKMRKAEFHAIYVRKTKSFDILKLRNSNMREDFVKRRVFAAWKKFDTFGEVVTKFV